MRIPVYALVAAAGIAAAAALALEWGAPSPAGPPDGGGTAAADRPAPPDAGSLASAAHRVEVCAGEARRSTASDSGPTCAGVLYVWAPEMPLSASGRREIAEAAGALGLSLDVVPFWQLADPSPGPAAALADRMVAAGATLHAPALVVHRDGELLGGAILGYKTSDAYRSLLAERLAEGAGRAPAAGDAALAFGPAPLTVEWRDFPVPGRPGPYFRWVPGRGALAYEAGQVVHLLDLESGERAAAPGYVDFVPTPDGALFVTPGPGRSGLEFYDAAAVFDAAARGRGRDARPLHLDRAMRDQYPSVGVLEAGADGAAVYRVLTSWFDRVAFRDYEVQRGAPGREPVVRPLAGPVHACPGLRLSIPILSPTGREVAARDEATATTKLFAIGDDGSCREVLDLGLPTGKVAWDPEASRVAFAIPRGAVRDGARHLWTGPDDPAHAGIFVFDRREGGLSRVEASMDAARLAFPEFVGRDRIVFLLPPGAEGAEARFRLVCCLGGG